MFQGNVGLGLMTTLHLLTSVNTKGANLQDTEKKWFSFWYDVKAKVIWLFRNYKKSDSEMVPSWHDKYSEVKSAATDEVVSKTCFRLDRKCRRTLHCTDNTVSASSKWHLKNIQKKATGSSLSQTHMMIRSYSSDATPVERFVSRLLKAGPRNRPSGGRRLTHGLFTKVGFRHLKLWCPIGRQLKKAPLIAIVPIGGSSPFLPHLRIPDLYSHVTVGWKKQKKRHKMRGGGDAQGR